MQCRCSDIHQCIEFLFAETAEAGSDDIMLLLQGFSPLDLGIYYALELLQSMPKIIDKVKLFLHTLTRYSAAIVSAR